MKYSKSHPFVVLALSLVLMAGKCKEDVKQPTFIKMKNWGVTEISQGGAVINATAEFNNPNNVSLKVRDININVSLEGKPLGTIFQTKVSKIPKNSNFDLPLGLPVNTKGDLLDKISIGLQIIKNKKANVEFDGFVKLSAYGIPFKVPVKGSHEIDVKKLK